MFNIRSSSGRSAHLYPPKFATDNASSHHSDSSNEVIEDEADTFKQKFNEHNLYKFSGSQRDEKERVNVDYSADMEPLKFKMNRSTRDQEPGQTLNEFIDSLAEVRERIEKVSGTGSTADYSDPFNLGIIDREQFETYLKEPKYVKVFHKREDIGPFNRLFLAQELESMEPNTVGREGMHRSSVSSSGSGSKAIWTTKFSLDGKYMATGGKDGSVRVWKVISSPIERWELNSLDDSLPINLSRNVKNRLNIPASSGSGDMTASMGSENIHSTNSNKSLDKSDQFNLYAPVFHPNPYRSFKEHLQDVLDMDWSKNNFLITASMDKTVKLWHIDRKTSLKTFTHADFVTSVNFHPSDDRFFISGCLDHKCRLWSIIDGDISYEFDCRDLITSITISPNEGKYTIVGTFNGYVHILHTKGLEHISSFHVKDKSTQGIHAKPFSAHDNGKIYNGPRVTGLQCFETKASDSIKLSVTTNDSRIRIFDVESRKLIEFLKGFHSGSSQHEAQYSSNYGKSIIMCSSDDHWVYGWKLQSQALRATEEEDDKSSFRSRGLRDLFGIASSKSDNTSSNKQSSYDSHKNLIPNPLKVASKLAHPHSDADIPAKKNSKYMTFHAHHAPVTTAVIAPVETAKTLSLSNDFICELTLKFDKELQEQSEAKGRDSSSKKKSNPNNPGDSHSLIVPRVIQAIGFIIVTTDNEGKIRVFRVDLSAEIRKLILQKLKCHKKIIQKESIKAPAIIPPRTNSLTDNMNSSSAASKTLRPSFSLRSNIFNKSNESFNSIRSRGPSINSIMEDSFTSTRNRAGSISGLQLHCGTCHGTKFETMGRNIFGQRETGHICVECGTVLNNFH